MCELCVVPPRQSAKQRHKLWEIRPDLHCSNWLGSRCMTLCAPRFH